MGLSISEEPWAVTIEKYQGGDPMCLDDDHLLVLHIEFLNWEELMVRTSNHMVLNLPMGTVVGELSRCGGLSG
jgi:hypothetical protein